LVQALDIAGEAGICREYGFSLPDKPSIAVLPFDNISNDPNQEIFVDGLTEDLITDLSKISGLFVIARNSTFIYKGKPVEIRTVAEDLGVRYVLEGSVRREGGRLRVNAQLIDAMTGGHIWADRFDGDVTNIFDVQDEFVLKIVKALAVELTESEKSEMGLGNTDNIEAREAFQRGWELFSKFNAHDNAKAESHFQKAIELDPEFGRAHAALALVYHRGYRFSWERQMGGSWDRLRRLAADTLKKGEQYPTPLLHVVAALEHVNIGLADQARIEAAQAIAKQPNDPEAHIAMAFAMIISGRPREA
jgi:TolB-like protein